MQITGPKAEKQQFVVCVFFFFKAKKEVKGPSEGLLHNAQGSKAVSAAVLVP